jgi:hypothetical protein
MEDVINSNQAKRNAINQQKQFATQKPGEAWDTGMDSGKKPFFVPNLSPRHINNTTANKTATNFSIFSHRSTLPINRINVSTFSPQDFDIS